MCTDSDVVFPRIRVWEVRGRLYYGPQREIPEIVIRTEPFNEAKLYAAFRKVLGEHLF